MNDVTVCNNELNAVMDREQSDINLIRERFNPVVIPAAVRAMQAHNAYLADVDNRVVHSSSKRQPETSDIALDLLAMVKDKVMNRLRGNPIQEEFDIQPDGCVHVATVGDLPKEEPQYDVTYKVLDSMEMYRYIDGTWKRINPYGGQPLPEVLEDDTARMPHGGMGTIAIVHNLNALRRDLWMRKQLGWSWEDMVPRDRVNQIRNAPDELTKQSLYFQISHYALWRQLKDAYKAGEQQWVEAGTSLYKVNTFLTICRDGNQPVTVFKDGDFEARWI